MVARWLWLLLAAPATALTPEQVLVIVNENSPGSLTVAADYSQARGIPAANVCRIRTPPVEEIDRATFERDIALPVLRHLDGRKLRERILCLVTTLGVPLKIRGTLGLTGTAASVDAELTTLYTRNDRPPSVKELAGPRRNPFHRSRARFAHPQFPMYLVTRLDAFTPADVHAMIRRSLAARNRGVVALDLRNESFEPGNDWLLDTARRLPEGRYRLEGTSEVLTGVRDVIGYAGWGSNDPHRKQRDPSLGWLPGGIATQYVSTDARTFLEPPAAWTPHNRWDGQGYWSGSPQSLTADLIRQGATGAAGHVYEPYLGFTPRPDELFTAYLVDGWTLAESFWRAIPSLSWMNVVVGDPLCRPGPAR